MIVVRKISETADSITLGWDPVAGADGYRFYSAGVLRSKTMDPARKTVKFSKGQQPYKIEAVVLHHLDEGSYPPSVKPPDPPTRPVDTGYPPQAYNQGSRGQNAKFNIHINCTLLPNGDYQDKNGLIYMDNGLCRSGRTEPNIDGLKPADMTDGKEPWESYEWMGKTIGPGPDDYPAQSYVK